MVLLVFGKVDVRLPGEGNSNSYGARPVHLIITMITWIRTSRLSTKNSLFLARVGRKNIKQCQLLTVVGLGGFGEGINLKPQMLGGTYILLFAAVTWGYDYKTNVSRTTT